MYGGSVLVRGMKRLSSEVILNELGIDYEYFCEYGEAPRVTDRKFIDLVPKLRAGGARAKEIADKRLYEHQLSGIKILEMGRNLIVKSGTGSGKTEIWVMYALMKGLKVLAIYPTLALASDQVQRIEDYYLSQGKNLVVKIDRPSITDKEFIEVRDMIKKAKVVITNPAFLMADMKRLAESRRKSYLVDFLEDVDLVVIDELDFYGSRGASLLIAMIELMLKYIALKRPQIVVLTATLGNVRELASILTSINDRNTEILEGKPFRVQNCTYIVYGKNLDSFRDKIKEVINRSEFKQDILRDLEEFLQDSTAFKRNVKYIIEYLRSYGLEVPEPYFDPAELISRYVDDEGVTVVFTPSIRTAERLARRVIELLPPNKKGLIVTHHHLVPKHVRDEIERTARNSKPKVKIIVTVRTLLQGVDIPTIVRIIHYGLPVELREYLQREGRKGRREELGFAESIIIPITPWDRAVLAHGIFGIEEFNRLPLEKVYILRSNKYPLLFKALFKVVAGISLSKEERELLKELGLVEEVPTLEGFRVVKLNSKGLSVWNKLNFYEFGPPYGLKRCLVSDSHLKDLEPASRRDFIEKYQPGSFDLANEALIVEASYSRIKEYPLSTIQNVINDYPYLFEAIRNYETIKYSWDERPDLYKDVIRGKLSSYVIISVRLPSNGFGPYYEVPTGVRWVVESSKRIKVIRYGSVLMPYYEERSIDLDSPTQGIYQDFTYGYTYELLPSIDKDLVRVAASALKLILRLMPEYAISFREIEISLDESVLPPPKLLLWEPEASGIIEFLDWSEILKKLDRWKKIEPKLWLPLLKLIDNEASNIVLRKGLRWSDVVELVKFLVKFIGRIEVVKIGDMVAYIPKPSPTQGIIAFEIIPKKINDEVYYIVAVFDGVKAKSKILKAKIQPYVLSDVIGGVLKRVIDSNNKLVTSQDDLIAKLIQSRSLMWLYEKALISGLIVNPYKQLRLCRGGDTIEVAELRKVFNIRLPSTTLIDDLIRKGKDVKKLLKDYAEGLAKIAYYTYLLYNYLRKQGYCTGKVVSGVM